MAEARVSKYPARLAREQTDGKLTIGCSRPSILPARVDWCQTVSDGPHAG